MDTSNQETLARATVFAKEGDYRLARETIRKIPDASGLSTEQRIERKRILAMTGIDLYMGSIVAITLICWLYLFVKYVL